MCLLVTKMSVKSFTNERPIEYLSLKVPLLSSNISMLVNKISRYILVMICFLIVTEVTKLGQSSVLLALSIMCTVVLTPSSVFPVCVSEVTVAASTQASARYRVHDSSHGC